MKWESLEALVCPSCHGELDFTGPEGLNIEEGRLKCTACSAIYEIRDGIPMFIPPGSLSGYNLRFARMYDLFSWAYKAFSKIAFAYIGISEEKGRREVTDRLDPRDGKVLEVSIGPGVNLPYLIRRPDVGEVFGLDISLGQLQNCRRYAKQKGWPVELFLGNGERLPFKDNLFGGVFHVGGINFFNDKKAAINEMIRVACPGARILIADETEKGARGYEKFLPGFKRSFGGTREPVRPPVDLVPVEMRETRVIDAWNGWMYCIEFRKLA